MCFHLWSRIYKFDMHNHPYSTWPRSSVSPYISRLVVRSLLLDSSITEQMKHYTRTDEGGCNSGRQNTTWPSQNALGRALISALLPVQANSSQLLPSRPLLQIDCGPQVLPTASLSLNPSTLNPIRFPRTLHYRWRPHRFTQSQLTSPRSHNIL